MHLQHLRYILSLLMSIYNAIATFFYVNDNLFVNLRVSLMHNKQTIGCRKFFIMLSKCLYCQGFIITRWNYLGKHDRARIRKKISFSDFNFILQLMEWKPTIQSIKKINCTCLFDEDAMSLQ